MGGSMATSLMHSGFILVITILLLFLLLLGAKDTTLDEFYDSLEDVMPAESGADVAEG